jgi:hypothetical protein
MRTQLHFAFISAFLFATLALAPPAPADFLAWDPPPEQVDGYVIHYGTSQSNLSQTRDIGNVTSYDLEDLPLSESVQYYLSVAAYNSAGEGPPAGPVAYTPADQTPPSPPVGLEVASQN